MKLSLSAVLLCASLGSMVLRADAPAVSGAWQVHISIAGNDHDLSCNFAQDGSVLSGTCNSDGTDLKLSGKVEDKHVTWSYKSEYSGSPITVKYDGKLDSDAKMSGTVSVPEFNADGDFSATHSK